VERDEVRTREQLLLGRQLGAGRGCLVFAEVVAPGDDVHAEGPVGRRHGRADPSESHDAERGAAEVGADGVLPAAVAQDLYLARDVPGQAENQCPGEFRRVVAAGGRGSSADRDLMRGGRVEVDGRVRHAGGHQQA
jgi:hypothetical protein